MPPRILGTISKLSYHWRLLSSSFSPLPTRFRSIGPCFVVCIVISTFLFFGYLRHLVNDNSISCALNEAFLPEVNINGVSNDALTLEEVRAMVARTNGFFARDYSLGLGWNNMRYIIESAALQAKVLNRTLVIPSFIYARACEYDISICADYFSMVNRNDAIGTNEWRFLTTAQQMGFRIPVSFMLNITLLRQAQPVILLSDYLQLHGLSSEDEQSNGAWNRDVYHSRANVYSGKSPSLYVVKNGWYDPPGSIRVDVLPLSLQERGQWSLDAGDEDTGPVGRWSSENEGDKMNECLESISRSRGRNWLEWNEVKDALKDCSGTSNGWNADNTDTEQAMESVAMKSGWEVVHTFRGLNNHEFAKTVVEPTKHLVPRTSLRGLREEYRYIDADVLIIEGETHLERKPGSMRLTSPTARDYYASMVLDYVQPHDIVYQLAEVLDQRMRSVNDGRMWMGAHMRRGDFLRIGWATGSTEDHIRRVKEHLESGRRTLADLTRDGFTQQYNIPHVDVEMSIVDLEPPHENDRFYVATDERDQNSRTIIASNGATFLTDLLTTTDKRSFGFELMLTDVRALVEQALLARSGYVYGHGRSSFAGGMVNMRARAGKDVRTVDLD